MKRVLLIIVALISIVMSVFLEQYLVKSFFTEKTTVTEAKTITTYRCYVNKGGKCYHAHYCRKLYDDNYEMTLYEAKKKGYGNCSYCDVYNYDPIREGIDFKTTTVKKNHLPAVIMSETAALILFLSVALPQRATKTKKED